MPFSARQRFALSLLLLVPLGIGTKLYAGPAGEWVRGHAGGVLYVVFWIVVVATVAPSLAPWKMASGVLFVTCLVEITQLWEPTILRQIRQRFIGRALLGTTFTCWDFPHYGLGAILGGIFVRRLGQTASEE